MPNTKEAAQKITSVIADAIKQRARRYVNETLVNPRWIDYQYAENLALLGANVAQEALVVFEMELNKVKERGRL